MKKISTAISGLLLSSMLFTACSKNDNNMAVTPSTTPGTSAKGVTTLLNFESGAIEATDVMIQHRGKTLYQAERPRSLDLFSTLSHLGIQPVEYTDMNVRINALANTGGMNFWLRDELVMEDGATLPVLFSIDEPITLHAKHKFLRVIDATNVMNLLGIEGNLLTQDITRDMLMNAEREDDVIRISRRINPDLYEIILGQLSSMVDISYGPAIPPTPPVPASEGPVTSVASPFTNSGGPGQTNLVQSR
jgi:hypothetical protein